MAPDPAPLAHPCAAELSFAQSRDSRSFGAIGKSEIVGRVFVRVWPLNRLGLL